jgi:hypothetical protein
MKQLPMTPALAAMIKERVGEDVDPTNFAVFETIALNTKPLPGKKGSLFEKAVVMPATLQAMVEYINSGNHVPLIADHELLGAPKGRMFHAGLDYTDGLEMRALFYLDPTEDSLIAKLNAGSLDEVSVAFLSKSFQCSECGWDYFQFGSSENIYERTCANGHKIGQNDVHGEMIGLNQFIELSLVARGAADKPKIVGKSQARLAPDAIKQLAANGFETDELVVQASIGTKEDTMDLAAMTAQLTELSTAKGELTVKLTTAEGRATTAEAEVTRLNGEVTTKDAEIAQLKEAAGDTTVATERDAAIAVLQSQVNALLTATGKPELKGEELPKTTAELKTKIDELTAGLTAILPTGGVSQGAGGDDVDKDAKLTFNPDAFRVRT